MCKYHLIPYNYDKYSFEELRDEQRKCKKGMIRWRYSFITAKPKRKFKIDKDDVCFFYSCNLPDLTSRILFRATVIQVDCEDEEGNDCFMIGNIRSIKLREPEEFSLYNLLNIYNIERRSLGGKQHLEINGRHKELLDKLNSESKGESVNQIKEYFKCERHCFFDGRDFNPQIHKTFEMSNGYKYYEIHHVIPQNTAKTLNIPQKKIDDLYNKVLLCPTCHSKIHLGKKEDKRKMLITIIQRNHYCEDFYLKCFNKCGNHNECNNVLDWLLKLTDIKIKEQSVDDLGYDSKREINY